MRTLRILRGLAIGAPRLLARAFTASYHRVKQEGVEGFCSWVLGEEDPAIWHLLPSHDHAAVQSGSQAKKN